MAANPQHFTDENRRQLEHELLAALLLVYQGHRTEAITRLHSAEITLGVPFAAQQKLEAFVAERARKVQDGVNERLAAAVNKLPDDASDDEINEALEQAKAGIDDHNETTLLPFLIGTTGTGATLDVARATPDPSGTGTVFSDGLWEWTQNTDFPDDCAAAADASPSQASVLIDLAGGEPQVHEGCLCTLLPLT